MVTRVGYQGGSLYMSRLTDALVYHCDFMGGSAIKDGGVMFISNSKLVLINVAFKDNSVKGSGAVIMANSGSVLFGINSTFMKNNAVTGGAIRALSTVMILSNVTIANNSAIFIGGAIEIDARLQLDIRDSKIFGNKGGKMAGSISVSDNSTFVVVNCILSNNSANTMGGAIDV